MTLIVNGEKIDDSAIQREAERLRPDYERVFNDQPKQQREAQLLEWSRENVIERVLINQHAKKNINEIPQAEIESVFAQLKKQSQNQDRQPEELDAQTCEKLKENIEQQLKSEKLLADTCKNIPAPSNEDIQKFYQENKQRFKTEEQIRVAHIVKHINWQSDETAAHNAIKKVHGELKNGAAFESLAEKYSDCPDNGGGLGYIKKGQMVEEFEDIVFNLSTGEISDIFRTRFGFHIAKLYDRKPAATQNLEEVKPQIINHLQEQIRRKAIDDFVDRLKENAKIEEIP